MGNPEAGIAILEPAIATLTESGPTRTLVDLLAALGRLLFFCGRHQESLEVWAGAVEVARAAHDGGALIQAESGWGSILSVMHRHDEAQRVLANVLPLIEVSQDLETLLLVLANLGQDCHDAGDFARGRAYSERALELSVRMADPFRTAWQTGALVNWLFLLGDWKEARTRGEQILAATRHLGTSWYTVYPLLELGRLSLAQGRLEEASAQLEECVLRAQEARYLQVLHGAHGLLAERDIFTGDAGAARARLESLLGNHHADPPNHRLALVLATAHLQLGDMERARAATLAAESWARETGSRLTLVEALRVHGMTAVRERRWEEAGQAFRDGAALARALPYPYEEARILYEEGVMHAQCGDARWGAERLEKAAPIFRSLGAQLWVERARDALHTLATR
jgi:tetratricopeptide (TPR) repeat protein